MTNCLLSLLCRSEAKDLLGDDWVQRHRRIVQQHANQYKRVAWAKVRYGSFLLSACRFFYQKKVYTGLYSKIGCLVPQMLDNFTEIISYFVSDKKSTLYRIAFPQSHFVKKLLNALGYILSVFEETGNVEPSMWSVCSSFYV